MLNPATISTGGYFGVKARRAYEAAKRYPATMDRLHCFCECAENFGHKTLLTCFTTRHSEHCGICIEEALMAAQLKKQGLSDAEVERWVEDAFRLTGHAPTADR